MFFQELLKYFENNQTQTIIISGIALLLLVTIIALSAIGSKAARKANTPEWIRQMDANTDSKPVADTKTAVTEEKANPAEAPKASPEKEVAVTEAPAEAPVEDPKTEAPTKAPAESEAPAEETKAEAPVEAKAETNQAPEKVTPPAPKKEMPKASKPLPAKKTPGTNAAKSALASTKKASEAIANDKAKTAAQPKENARYAGKWVICKLILSDTAGKVVEENYFFELRASNGERLLTSEEYTSQAGAVKGIQTHKDNVLKGNFRIVLSKRGDYIFKLLSAKNTLLCTGANYKTLERCERAIASTKRFAETAQIQEEIEDVRVTLPAEDDTPVVQPEPPKNGYTGKWIISYKGNEDVGVMYYFELFASNGEKLLTSEEYTTYEGAVNAVETHKANIAKDNFRITITKRGDYLFKLLSGNGQLLCVGEHYKTRSRCENAVESVKRFSQSAPVFKHNEINQ